MTPDEQRQRDDAIDTLARTLDVPPELMAIEGNDWSAWEADLTAESLAFAIMYQAAIYRKHMRLAPDATLYVDPPAHLYERVRDALAHDPTLVVNEPFLEPLPEPESPFTEPPPDVPSAPPRPPEAPAPTATPFTDLFTDLFTDVAAAGKPCTPIPCEYEPELDDIGEAELGEGWLGEMPVHTLAALRAWRTQTPEGSHGVGTFLDELAARGYRVTPIPDEPFPLLPPPTE